MIGKKLKLLTAVVALVSVASAQPAQAKKYRRALVIAGGGIAPGVALGMINGARAMGWNPDVVISTCGASMGAAIDNSYQNIEGRDFALSATFQNVMNLATIETKSVKKIKKNFEALALSPLVPNYFENNILKMPEALKSFLPRPHFNRGGGTRYVVIAAKSTINRSTVGQVMGNQPRFKEVFFTDPDTAEVLQGMSSPIKEMFPESRLFRSTEVNTTATVEEVVRATISDPFLINPGRIGDDYYFTGAVDLFPIDVAKELADEVLITYPGYLFTRAENLDIMKSYGFNQTAAALRAVNRSDVKWIDISGYKKLTLDPVPAFFGVSPAPEQKKNAKQKDSVMASVIVSMLKMKDKVHPAWLGTVGFRSAVQKQFEFGWNRVQEALVVSRGKNNVRSHLREPINPRLLNAFTCANAYVWSTPTTEQCWLDSQKGCNRKTEKECTPIR